MSPDFTCYLDIDQQKGLFTIRDTFTQRVKCEIPQWLMNINEISEAVHRFRWVDNRTIKVINNEGFERVFDIETMSENCFNAVPLFQYPKGYHYYFDKPILQLQNVGDRLLRKY
jgi:hypothetical protein